MTRRVAFAPSRPPRKRRVFERRAVRRRRERLHVTKYLIDMAANLLATLFAR